MSQNYKNDDGTVNFDGLKNHLDFVKGKYAQNAKNHEANTGKGMETGGDANADVIKGKMEEKVQEPTTDKEAAEQAQ